MMFALILAAIALVGIVIAFVIYAAAATGAREDRERAELIAREHGHPLGNVDRL